MHNTPQQNADFRAAFDATNARYKASEGCPISWQVLIVYNDSPNETAILDFATYKEAEENRRAFVNYGKCLSVSIIQKVN